MMMPLHDVGYRPWRGERCGYGHAVGVIAGTGIRLAWTSRWLRRAVFFAWSPALLFAASFFAFEQAVDQGQLGTMQEQARAGRNLDGVGVLGAVLARSLGAPPPDGRPLDANSTRHMVWARLLLAFMRAPQAVLLAVVVGLVAPTLISRDLRAKAWLVYFTRPVGKLEYILGKMAILGVLVAAITMLPALALWALGVLVSPSVWVAVATWDLPLKIILASLTLAVPTVLMALAYSSLTAESRIASFAWFATWAACWIAHTALTTADLVAAAEVTRLSREEAAQESFFADEAFGEFATVPPARQRSAPRGFRWLSRAAGLDSEIDRWAWLSPYHALGVVQAWIFGIETRWRAVLPPLVSLLTVTAVSSLVLWRRVDAPARA
jgi:hypothetical protein